MDATGTTCPRSPGLALTQLESPTSPNALNYNYFEIFQVFPLILLFYFESSVSVLTHMCMQEGEGASRGRQVSWYYS